MTRPTSQANLPRGIQATLELLAVSVRAMSAGNLSRLLHLAPYSSELGKITAASLDADLRKLNSAVSVVNGCFALNVQADELRCSLIDSFCESGRASSWANLALPSQEFRRSFDHGDTQQLLTALLALNLLGGAAPDHLIRITRLSYWPVAEIEAILMWLMRPPVSTARLSNLHQVYRQMALSGALTRLIEKPHPLLSQWLELGRREIHRPGALPHLREITQEHLLLSGEAIGPNWAAADPWLRSMTQANAMALQGAAPTELLPAYDAALRLARKEFGRSSLLAGLSGKLHLLALLVDTSPAARKRLESLTRKPRELPMVMGGFGQQLLCHFARHELRGASWTPPTWTDHARPDDQWLLALLCRWSDKPLPKDWIPPLSALQERVKQAGWLWLASALDAVLAEPGSEAAQSGLEPRVLPWREVVPAWRRSLSALSLAFDTPAKAGSPAAEGYSRLQMFLIGAENRYGQPIEVTEQRPGKRGWSAGKLIRSMRGLESVRERLPTGEHPDRRLLDALVTEAYQSYDIAYLAEDSAVWEALVGHQQVYRRSGSSPPECVEVVLERPELKLTRRDDGWLQIRLSPLFDDSDSQLVIHEDKRVRVIPISSEHRKLQEIVGEGLAMPTEALSDLANIIPQIAQRITLHSDIDGGLEVERDDRLVVRLQPNGDGLRAWPVVQPLGPGSADYTPGSGSVTALGIRDGAPVTVERALAQEQGALKRLVSDCPLLQGLEHGEIEIDEPERALELVEQLQELVESRPEQLRLEWPAGKMMKVGKSRTSSHLQLRVGAQRDWFSAEGGLSLDNERVVDLSRVLQLLPSARGRFVALDDEHFVSISSDLRRRLEQLRGLADERGRIEVAPIAAAALASLLDDDSEVDEAFRVQIERIDAAQKLRPRLPRGLQAELRDYQIEGFRWLMRLAAMDAGACLADDMGLGKTVQTLALLLARAETGPALVVAPTSVVSNWASEARRFAPDLRIKVYADIDRDAVLEALGPHDVLLISYGLVSLNIETLAKLDIATLVLDEAQAIKNPATQRYRAVRSLKARFRIATTGTPIENHLGELWALFRILNPGLLGSQERFNKRFVRPIELNSRGSERDLLRRLISPFLLRRTKAQVLDELPPRTEVTLSIQPSQGEAELLSALRREAVEKLAHDAGTAEQKRFNILAALTRLRRAACHPDLVAPELKLRSSKIDALVKLVDELRDNQHRVLVFSQFVDFLSRVREAFDGAGISYQYLDGQTSPKAREQAVIAFQGGQGDAFLLSLKAGGVGLNLTAADYVIHLDPWWNPAVEMQASDRAHRIGQTRPVTVYKLVVAGSIEEQILSLHGSKRELADSLLGDQDQAERLRAEDLLALLHEAGS